jgi:hypothetical protein
MGSEQVQQSPTSSGCSWVNCILLALFALKLAALVGVITYVATSSVSAMDDLISGHLALSGMTAKSRDYGAAIAFVLAGIFGFVLAYEGLRRAARLLPAPVISKFHSALLLANIPAALAVGRALFQASVDPELIAVSLAAEFALVMCLVMSLSVAGRSPDPMPEASGRAFYWVLAVLLFAYVAGGVVPSGWAATVSALGLLGLTSNAIAVIALVSKVTAAIVAAFACAAAFASPDIAVRERRLKLLFLLTQGALLPGLVKLSGSLASVDGQTEYLVSATSGAILALLLLGIGSALHLLVMARALLSGRSATNFWFIASPVAVALLAVLLKTSPDMPSMFNLLDEYHTGEYVLPYWTFKTWRMLPYIDLDPARGWVMLFTGLIAEEWLGGSYVSYAYTASQRFFFVFLFLFVATRPLIGIWGALLLVVLAPIGNLAEIGILFSGLLALLWWAYFALPPALWLVLWVLLGTLGVLAAPGQGGLLVLATMPLGLLRAFAAMRTEHVRLVVAVIGLLAVAGFALQTLFGETVQGAVRYAIEQSSINSQAHAIPWAESFHHWKEGKGVLFEVVRSSWLLVTMGIGISAWVVWRSDRPLEQKRRFLIAAIPIVLLGLLFIPRAWGRIDVMAWSRPGAASVLFVALLLPLFVFAVNRRRVAVIGILFISVAAAIMPGTQLSFSDANTIQSMATAEMIDGAEHGVPALGTFTYQADRVANYAALKHFADSELPRGAPLLDLTSRNSLLYMLERPPALPAAAYNLASPAQQVRTVRALAANPPSLALADSLTVRHDGGVLGLRANTLFRFVIENYSPLEDSGAVWMRYDPSGPQIRDEAQFQLLDRAFMQRGLGNIPSSWGLAWSALADKTTGEVLLDPGIARLNDVAQRDDGAYVITGADPYIVIPVPNSIDGANWGLLVFDFACDTNQDVPLQVFWTNEAGYSFTETASFQFKAQPGRVVVPLDIAPRWVIGGKASQIRIDLVDPSACSSWSVTNIRLTQRVVTKEIQALLRD